MCERRGGTHVRCAGQCQITLVQKLQQLLFSGTSESFNTQIHKTEQCLLRRRCCYLSSLSSQRISDSSIPPLSPLMSTFPAISIAVVRSHIWMLPLLCPLKRYRRGLDPMRLDPSHSCTTNAVMDVPSTERTSHTLQMRHGSSLALSRCAAPMCCSRVFLIS